MNRRSNSPDAAERTISVPTIIRPLIDFLRTEAAGGVVLLIAAVSALAWANSPWASTYVSLWKTTFPVQIGALKLRMDMRHWVNDFLMTLFFFLAGLEIKRELVEGELRDFRKAIAPVAGAIGGMVIPAGLFFAITRGTVHSSGWAIPTATDIALAIGVLSIVGRRLPSGAKLFLLTLAIVDDIGAIALIALFYRKQGKPAYLLAAVATIVAMILLRRASGRHLLPFVFGAAVLWMLLREGGVHPTLAGVLAAMLLPTRGSHEGVSTTAWVEHRLHAFSSFVVVPLFALANLGIVFSTSALRDAASSRLFWASSLGLLVGKPTGILLFTLVVVHLGWARLPDQTNWSAVTTVALVSGIGFTVSLLVAQIAFPGSNAQAAKLGVLLGSIAAALLGLLHAMVRTPTTAALSSSSGLPTPTVVGDGHENYTSDQ